MRTLATKARAINQYNGLGNQLWDLAGNRPSLDLPFADNKSLVDATTGANLVDFTRASSGTYVDSEGVIRTATTNLLLRSEEFETTWTTARASVSSDSIASPSGTTTADKLVEDTTQTSTHLAQQSVSVTTGTAYTFSLFAKAGERNFVQLVLQGQFATVTSAIFDLSTGVVGATTGTPSTSAVLLSDGWWRLSITATANATGSTSAQVRVSNSSATATYTGDGTSGIYLWGAQLEQSTTVGEYVPTTSTINSAPRFDHDPTTGESLGLLVEEQRTNSITNNTMVGAVAGTPGTNPTGWFLTASANGISPEIVGTGVEDGITYVDIRYSGTSTNLGNFSILASTVTAITAATGQSWTGSAYVKLQAGSLSNLTNTLQSVNGRSSIGAGLESTNATYTPTSDSLGVQRRTVSITLANASTARISHTIFNAAYASGATIDITLRIGLPQLEQGAFATSVIPTSGTAATRAAEVASISGSNFGVSRTNLLLRSEEFDNASWAKGDVTVQGNAALDPNGSTLADKLITSATTAVHNISQAVTASSAAHTFSIYLKAAELTTVSIRAGRSGNFVNADINLSLGTIASPTTSGTATNVSSSIQSVSNDWYRCSVTGSNLGDGQIAPVIYIPDDASLPGDGTSGIYLWGAQLETGSTATAYIPTTTTAVTVVESPWYRQDEGTLFADARTQQSATGHILAGVSTGSFASSAYLSKASDNFLKASPDAAPSSLNISLQSVSSNVGLRAALAFTAGTGSASATMNGGTVGTDASTGIPITMSQIGIGTAPWSTGTTLWNGHIARLTYWPARLSDSTLQTITQ